MVSFQGTQCPPAPPVYCPTFDALSGLSEPASCNTVSTVACASDLARAASDESLWHHAAAPLRRYTD
jgi:hypothetical protein